MIITHELAQNIAYKTSVILKRNVNIMNHEGNIIGSSDKNRRNIFHEGAFQVIKTGTVLEITEEECLKMEGSKPGVNLPIYFDDKIVGVVGISGNPDEVRPYGELLKIAVETMLVQSFLEERGAMEKRTKDNYVLDLLNFDPLSDEDVIMDRGKALGYYMYLPRLVLTGAIEEVCSYADFNKISAKKEMDINIQKDMVLKCVGNYLGNPQNILSFVKNNIFLIFKVIRPEEIISKRGQEQLFMQAQKIQSIIKSSTGLTSTIGIGSYHEGIAGLKKSYQEAMDAITVGRKLKGPGQIYRCTDISLAILAFNLSQEVKENYISYIEHGEEGCESLDETLIKSLESLIANDLNLSEAARSLYIHRNTLSYRIAKIERITGLNPAKYYDSMKLKIYLLLKELM